MTDMELKAYIGPAPDEKGLADYYLKSEADKVIAELIKKNERLSDDCLIKASNTFREIEKEIRHHKYKRCLAMAEWCRESLRVMRTYEVTEDFWNLEPGQDAEYFCKKGDFYSKWRKRWLELAEKFKPNKSTAQ